MTTKIAIAVAVSLAVSAGCNRLNLGRKKTGGPGAEGPRVLLTVDHEPGRTLRYAFTSNREIALDWDPQANGGAGKVQKQSEWIKLVVAYTPQTVDPYGISTIRAVCESVEIKRTGRPSGRGANSDAVQAAQGKTFTLKVDSRGKIVDYSELRELIGDLGAAAFRSSARAGRVKEPDMIGDFILSQWFLWDAVSTVEDPSTGVAVGRSWHSQLWLPVPMVMRKARDVTYRLEEVREDDAGRLAVIGSAYSLADAAPSDWPIPYSGRFQMSGTFGFLGGYQVLWLEGAGLELFNVDAGRIESAEQRYTMRLKGSLPPMGIRANPHITIEQILTTELLNP
ncbi:MAG: hypothetical protein JSW27_00850 [Phycisphaerales bacterium]|nr:MAG: hypothetical protein JSW27_00850 [Phycisphaerales bacterium]